MALSEGALEQVSECDVASQPKQRLRVVKIFHQGGVLGKYSSGVDRLSSVAHCEQEKGPEPPDPHKHIK